ncbi:MAG TPA: hypothetical protein VHT73_09385 [Thermodesulfobacteriota bacterium]|nr:hypothetical protein [Thermodesulfobacteriota bacterium]
MGGKKKKEERRWGMRSLIILIGFIILSCSSTPNIPLIDYETFKPDPEDYGLRVFSYQQGKGIYVAKEHDDNYVLFYTASSLNSLAQMGMYADTPQEVMEVYKYIDELYKSEPDKAMNLITSDNKLSAQIGKDAVLAGSKMTKFFSNEELQKKYLTGLEPADANVVIERMRLYNEALIQARQNAIEYNTSLLEAYIRSQKSSRSYNWRTYAPPVDEGVTDGGRTVYSPDECIGPVIMGECKGTIIPKGGYHQKCYGEWVGGQCTGPQF